MPAGLETAWDLTLHNNIRRQLKNGHTDLEQLKNLLNEAQSRPGVLNADISFAVKNRMERLIQKVAAEPGDVAPMRELQEIARLVMPLPLGLNVAEVQNTYWEMKQRVLPDMRQRASQGDENAQDCLKEFLLLGEHLGFAPHALQ